MKNQAVATTTSNYGLDMLGIFLSSRDYGWTKPDESQKRVVLTNPLDCKDFTLMDFASAWCGTGHSEWEALMGAWFIQAVHAALDKNLDEADITDLFNRDFLASNRRSFTKAQVYQHLIKWFNVVKDTNEVLELELRV